MATSKLQRATGKELSLRFSKYTIRENIRPEWLLDVAGRRLELDFYIEELNIAVEVQGEQHYEYVPLMHGDYNGFLDLQNRDKLKKDACDALGIILLEVWDDESLQETIDVISKADGNQLNIEYIGLPINIKTLLWRLQSFYERRQGNYQKFRYAESIHNYLVKILAENPTILQTIHPELAKHLIRTLRYSEHRIEVMKDKFNRKVFNRRYRKWARGHTRKGGIVPSIEEYLETLHLGNMYDP